MSKLLLYITVSLFILLFSFSATAHPSDYRYNNSVVYYTEVVPANQYCYHVAYPVPHLVCETRHYSHKRVIPNHHRYVPHHRHQPHNSHRH